MCALLFACLQPLRTAKNLYSSVLLSILSFFFSKNYRVFSSRHSAHSCCDLPKSIFTFFVFLSFVCLFFLFFFLFFFKKKIQNSNVSLHVDAWRCCSRLFCWHVWKFVKKTKKLPVFIFPLQVDWSHQVPRLAKLFLGRAFFSPCRFHSRVHDRFDCSSLNSTFPVWIVLILSLPELGTVQKYAQQFQKRSVKVIGLSCDDKKSHEGWIKVNMRKQRRFERSF